MKNLISHNALDYTERIYSETSKTSKRYRIGRFVKKAAVSGLAVATLLSIGNFGFSNGSNESNGTSTIVQVEAASIKMSASSKTIYKGKSVTLKVKNTKKKAKWSSTNKKVATVNSKGKVTGKKAGTCYIKAKVGKKTVKCKITVKNKKSTTPKFADELIDLKKGSSYTYKVVNAGSTIKWSTSNSKIATVNSKGKVTAKSVGTCYIYAKTKGKTLKTKLHVFTVNDTEKLEVSQEAIELVNKERAKLGLSQLEYDSRLGEASKIRAKELETLRSHTRPNGLSSSSVLSEVGYPAYVFEGTVMGHGECGAWGYGTASQAVISWKNSTAHWNILMDPDAKYISIANYNDYYWIAITEYFRMD